MARACDSLKTADRLGHIAAAEFRTLRVYQQADEESGREHDRVEPAEDWIAG